MRGAHASLAFVVLLVSSALLGACAVLDENTIDESLECAGLCGGWCGAVGCACVTATPACIESLPTASTQACQACATLSVCCVVGAPTVAGGGSGCVVGACTRCAEGPDAASEALVHVDPPPRDELPPRDVLATHDATSSTMEY